MSTPESASAEIMERANAAALLARMEGVPFTWWHAKARLVMGSATFFDAFNALSLAFALPILIRAWHITPAESGVLIGASYVGQLAGALIFSWLAERRGRIPSAVSSVALMSVMSLACIFAGNFTALLVCRLIQGIGVGGEMPVAATYISELSQARGRGRFFLLYEMIFPVGLMATGQIGAVAVPLWGWQVMFVLAGIPGLIIAYLLARLPESPRWLIAHGRFREAERVVEQVEASTAKRVSLPDDSPRSMVPLHERARWREVLSPVYRSRTLIAWPLWFCAYFVSNSLNNWMPSLYSTVYHLGLRESLRAASLLNVAQVAVLLVCAFAIDRVGRRNWTSASFSVGAVLLLILGFGPAASASRVMILGTLTYGVIGSANAVLYLYTPEIYPTRMRAIGTGLSTSWLRVASAIGPAVVGILVGAKGIGPVFWMFAAVALVGAVAALGMLETRNRRLEDIAP
ncbi:MAG TPA: MFS transporter [Bryobacteraceae bacterium]|nr:MFS transporter [Bryobacteraceae bacterium]HUO30123.1 MFS transporter [Bryobacteraceae bacterium]